ncbi:MAG: hypothetical protein L0229_30540 [Blastocatellia bacterium]|nr:hypothetical protein [Blastocatellia bacterium]
MKNISKKWQVRLAALAIFALGALAGGLAFNLYRARGEPGSPPLPGDTPVYRFERILDRLELSAEQTTEVEKILGDARAQLIEVRKESEPKFRDIRKQTEDRLRSALTPEQWQQFQEIKDRMKDRGRGRHKRGRSKSKDR